MKNALRIKIYYKKLFLNKISLLKHPKPPLLVAAILLLGALTIIFYHSLAPTKAAASNITVVDNNQTVTESQSAGAVTLTKTSIVTVKDASATNGYALTATLNSTLVGAVVAISQSASSECPTVSPCTLSAGETTILATNNNNATVSAGETTTFDVVISLPTGTAVGAYTVDIVYDETPNIQFAATVTNPAANQVLDYDTTSTNLTVTTNKNATCKYSDGTYATYESLPNTFANTGGTTHSQTIDGLTNSSTYTYSIACMSTNGEVSAIISWSWSVSNTPPVAKIVPDGSSIQSVNATNCAAATTFIGNNEDAISKVYDSRDNNYYAIAKLPDGRCWMLTSLAYSGEIDSNGNDFGTMNHYASGNGSSGWNNGASYIAYYTNPTNYSVTQHSSGKRCSSSYRTTASSINYTECGFIYSWYAATAGTGTANLTSGDAPASICPVNWHLPTGSNTGEFAYLNGMMAGDSDASTVKDATHAVNWIGASSIWRGVTSGSFNPGYGLVYQGSTGSYWSATLKSSTQVHGLGIGATINSVYLGDNDTTARFAGRAVRCVANF
ncbi:MAG: fibrobacter succinogenes major paralogous domain-containing protein [Candidatus Nomurabacteria bacterium]|jgi:uncharacterized protein (TIGR02145 family)|nr:fibrobacter succinogenes major paralogous domain-containing protein [Candidatus Nomurabacteria bacterium]